MKTENVHFPFSGFQRNFEFCWLKPWILSVMHSAVVMNPDEGPLLRPRSRRCASTIGYTTRDNEMQTPKDFNSRIVYLVSFSLVLGANDETLLSSIFFQPSTYERNPTEESAPSNTPCRLEC